MAFLHACRTTSYNAMGGLLIGRVDNVVHDFSVCPAVRFVAGGVNKFKEIDRMSTRKHSSHAEAKPQTPKAPVREPGKPLPKQASQQQQAGTPSGAASRQPTQGEHGEGNYKATRDYDEGLKRHIATHDVEREAQDAAPRSRREAEDMERAEEIGRARGRGDDIEEDKNA
jgi:hypothetical protein